jgi:hypothetical protein
MIAAMKRREFITLLGGAAVVWPIAARGQQTAANIRIHLSLPSSQLGPSQAGDRWRVHGNSCSYWRGCSVLERCTA